jgi:putative membrane protein
MTMLARIAAFTGGCVALAVAWASPLDALGMRLLSAHTLQVELLMLVAAPLLVLGRPRALCAVITPRWEAQRTCFTESLAPWGLQALALWLWHVPRFFDAALRSEGLHALQLASFLLAGVLFWWAVLGGDPRSRQGGSFAIVYLLMAMLHTAALGAALTLAPSPWYAGYAASTGALGVGPMEDQQLGGLMMWVPGGVAYLIAGLAIGARVVARRRIEPAVAAHPNLPG